MNEYVLGCETARNCVNQQKKDCNLSFILIVTVVMFFIFHTPRIIISIYEAVTIQNLVRCTERQKGYFLIWYLYVQAALQLLQVNFSHLVSFRLGKPAIEAGKYFPASFAVIKCPISSAIFAV